MAACPGGGWRAVEGHGEGRIKFSGMTEKAPDPGTPDPGLIVVRSDGNKTDHFPQYRAAVDFIRAVCARRRLLSDLFADMQRASDEAHRLDKELADRYPGERRYSDTLKSNENSKMRPLRNGLPLKAAVCLVMILDGLLQRLGKALERDTRALGAEAANGQRLARLLWSAQANVELQESPSHEARRLEPAEFTNSGGLPKN